MQTNSRNIRLILAKHFETNIRDPRVIACTEELTGEKIKTGLDGWLGETLEFKQREDAVKQVLDELESGLRINIKRDTNSAAIAKKIIAGGKPVSKWLEWYRSDQFRLASMHYMNIDKVWAMWPAAFANDNQPKKADLFETAAPPPAEWTTHTGVDVAKDKDRTGLFIPVRDD